MEITSKLKDPDGFAYYVAALAYAAGAYLIGWSGLFHPDWRINVCATLFLGHAMVIAAYLIHDCAHNMISRSVKDNAIHFGIGPAGTGKTYLAVACGVEALLEERVRRIMLVRPAVEAGEKLGFLPGDLSQKIDPYLRPLYDALYEMLGFEAVNKYIERNIIEVAPLAFMRGRTLNNAFIILDEAQNTTREQMKMFLTRIGFGSTAVVTGDATQIDLPKGVPSGLTHVSNILDGVDGLGFTYFGNKDVVRHPLVQRIVEAYDSAEDRATPLDKSQL